MCPFRIASYQPGDEYDIVDLFSLAFPGRKLPVGWWYWRFRDNPNGKGTVALAWDGDRLIGHYGAARINLCVDGEIVLTGNTGSMMTHPNYRGQGIFAYLNQEIHAQLCQEKFALVWSFPNHSSHRLYIDKINRVDIYEIPMFSLTLNTSNQSFPTPGPQITTVYDFDVRFDHFWQKEACHYGIITQRNAQFLQWRFSKHPTNKYQIVIYQDADYELRGYIVFKRYKNEYQIVDVLVDAPEIGVELISYTVHKAIQDKLESIVLWLNVNHPLHRGLEKLGFSNRGHITYFAGRILLPFLDGEYIYAYRNWYLTMGDSDVF